MKNEYMTNSEGHLVPIEKVKPEDRLEDELVSEFINKAEALQKHMAGFKEDAFTEIAAFLDIISEKYDVSKGGKKGNLTLTSYDGMYKVQVSVADYIQFGPQLQIAKELIDQCITTWSEGSNDNIRVMVNHAFRVDKNNRVNTSAILGLQRLDIKDEMWKNAMEAIKDSVRVTRSKEYVRFYKRSSAQGDWRPINLDIAKL